VLARARRLVTAKPGVLTPLQRGALRLEARCGHDKATVALANRLARIFWAVWKHDRHYNLAYAMISACPDH
jgi:hypothetical protein